MDKRAFMALIIMAGLVFTGTSAQTIRVTQANPITYKPTVVSSPSQTDTAITLTWTKTDPAIVPILETCQCDVLYTKSANGTLYIATTITDWNQTSYTVTGLKPGTTYWFTIEYIGVNGFPNAIMSNALLVSTKGNPENSAPMMIIIGLVIALILFSSTVLYRKRKKRMGKELVFNEQNIGFKN